MTREAMLGMAPTRITAVKHGLILAMLILDAYIAIFILTPAQFFADGISWWTVNLSDPYAQARGSLIGVGAFRYSPVVAQILQPVGLLPWPVFVAGFTALQIGCLMWMGRSQWWLLLIFPPTIFELWTGNIDILLAAAIFAGFRWPAAWSAVILTKVTPGVGLLWFVFRREWRSLVIALGFTILVAAVSFLLAPDLWRAWIDALRVMSSLPNETPYPPLVVRLPIAVLVLWVAARRDIRPLVPVAVLLAMPSIWGVSYAVLTASLALWLSSRDRRGPGAVGIEPT